MKWITIEDAGFSSSQKTKIWRVHDLQTEIARLEAEVSRLTRMVHNGPADYEWPKRPEVK